MYHIQLHSYKDTLSPLQKSLELLSCYSLNMSLRLHIFAYINVIAFKVSKTWFCAVRSLPTNPTVSPSEPVKIWTTMPSTGPSPVLALSPKYHGI